MSVHDINEGKKVAAFCCPPRPAAVLHPGTVLLHVRRHKVKLREDCLETLATTARAPEVS